MKHVNHSGVSIVYTVTRFIPTTRLVDHSFADDNVFSGCIGETCFPVRLVFLQSLRRFELLPAKSVSLAFVSSSGSSSMWETTFPGNTHAGLGKPIPAPPMCFNRALQALQGFQMQGRSAAPTTLRLNGYTLADKLQCPSSDQTSARFRDHLPMGVYEMRVFRWCEYSIWATKH